MFQKSWQLVDYNTCGIGLKKVIFLVVENNRHVAPKIVVIRIWCETRAEICCSLSFFMRRNTDTELHKNKKTYSESTMCKHQVFEWYHIFQEGHSATKSVKQIRQPVVVPTAITKKSHFGIAKWRSYTYTAVVQYIDASNDLLIFSICSVADVAAIFFLRALPSVDWHQLGFKPILECATLDSRASDQRIICDFMYWV